MPTD
jgi:hypothetical protein